MVDGELVRAVLLGHGREITDDNIKEMYRNLVKLREEKLKREKEEPMIYGWEPPIWRVCDALLGLDWAIPAKYGDDYGAKMRSALGFAAPVNMLLINGGNRASKSEYVDKRASQCLNKFPNTTLWSFHTDTDMSVQYDQPLYRKYMPQVWRTSKPIQTQTAYIAYKKKTGFSDGSFILPNGSWCDFRNYAQDKTKIEGGELGTAEDTGEVCLGMVAHELIPEDWVETLVLRLATRGASGVINFTPVNGYTGTVKAFLDGAKVARDRVAYMLPKDGGEADDHCLDLEDCDKWVDGEKDKSLVGGRHFDRVPRVLRCADKRRAVVFFHSSDNPYGNPKEVMLSLLSRDSKFKRERFYGVADRLVAGKFPLFDPAVHVKPHDELPSHGTNYMLVDPCDGRNFFMIWVRCTPDGRMYVYREWPSQTDPIPGVGVLGEWALPTGDTKMLDGRRGPAQSGLGWGLTQYKKEIARLEGWEEYDASAEPEAIAKWKQYPEDMDHQMRGVKAREKISSRFLDARFGNVRSLEADGTRTLFEEFDNIGIGFRETGADVKKTISEGVQLINDALYYNVDKPVVTDLNEPKLYISERCLNVTFALHTWTGHDGPKGSTKDCIDLLRYAYLKDLEHVDESPGAVAGTYGAGCY